MVFFFKCKQQSTPLLDNATENNANIQQNNIEENNKYQKCSLQFSEKTFVLSTAPPNEDDIQKTEELVNSLKFCGVLNFELDHAYNSLAKLKFFVDKWLKATLKARNTPKNIVEKANAQVYTYGNYKLGVHNKEDRVSILCVTPWYITRIDFFMFFSNFLVLQPEVTNLQVIRDEVIQLKLEGIDIDIFFARLPLTELHNTINFQDEMLLKNIDPACFTSLYGLRVTNQILQLIPNMQECRLTVRAIKLWAKHNGIHSNVHGFLNDAAWTLLVVRICQSYPQAVAATLIQKFFLIYSNWKWPEPVFIKKLPAVNSVEPAWDPKVNIRDSFELPIMPIMTPVEPQRNIASNVSISTRTIMVNAFKVASQLTEQILLGKESWDRLFHPSSFFTKYEHYIVLMANAGTYLDHLHWRSFIEVEVKHLLDILEANPYIALVHINSENFGHFKMNSNNHNGCSMWFIGMVFAKTNFNLDLSYDMQNFIMETIQKARSANIFRAGMDLIAKRIKQEQLPLYIPPNILNFGKTNNENFIEKKTNSNKLLAESTVNKEKLTPELQHTINKTSDSEEEDDTYYKTYLKNHGYKSSESESDDGKSESDDELRAMKPSALPYNDFKDRIIKVDDSNKSVVINKGNQNGNTHFNNLNNAPITKDTLLPTWFIDELLHDGRIPNSASWKGKPADFTSQTIPNLSKTTEIHNSTSVRNYMNVNGPNLFIHKSSDVPQIGAPIFQASYVRPPYLGNMPSNWNPNLIQYSQSPQQIYYPNGIGRQVILPTQNTLFYQNRSNLPRSVPVVPPGHNIFNSNLSVSQIPPPGIIPPAMRAHMSSPNLNTLYFKDSQQQIQNNLDSKSIVHMNEHKHSELFNSTQINNKILENKRSWADIATVHSTNRENNTLPKKDSNKSLVLETKNDLQKDKRSIDILTSDPQMFPSLQDTVNKYQGSGQINKKELMKNENNGSRRRKKLENKVK